MENGRSGDRGTWGILNPPTRHERWLISRSKRLASSVLVTEVFRMRFLMGYYRHSQENSCGENVARSGIVKPGAATRGMRPEILGLANNGQIVFAA